MIPERCLQRVQSIAHCQALHGPNLRPVRLNSERQTAAHCKTVKEYRAGPTNTVLTTQMRPCETELVTQEIRQGQPNIDFSAYALPIDRDLDLASPPNVCIGTHDAPAAR